jgi:hypothetical protein
MIYISKQQKNQQFDALIYEWVGLLVQVNIWMWCFPNHSGIHVAKSYWIATPTPHCINSASILKNATKFPFCGQKYWTHCYFTLCCTFIHILICPIINRYFELPKTLLISYKADWGNLFWTDFGFCFLIGMLSRLHYHIYLCIFMFTWTS